MNDSDKTSENSMHIKIQKGSRNGVTNNKGSCTYLAEYLNHEDKDRIAMGLQPFPYTTPDGLEIPTDCVVKAIDGNGKGLAKNDNKFFHLVVAPSKEEIQALGDNDEEVYRNALFYIKLISDAYAKNFHKPGLEEASDLVMFWKPHFTRQDNGDLQFHLHAIVSRRTSEMNNGKRYKISPLTTHREDAAGPIQGGFNRNAWVNDCQRIFDLYTGFERKVSKTFEYQNAIANGTVEEKAAQADRLAQEAIAEMKESIIETVKQKDETPELNVPEEELDCLAAAMKISSVKQEIMSIFHNNKDQATIYLALASMGITCTIEKSQDGIEGISFETDGISISIEDIFDKNERETLFSDVVRITGKELGETIRERRIKHELNKSISQQKYDGPGLSR